MKGKNLQTAMVLISLFHSSPLPSLYVALAGLELTVYTRLVSNSQSSACLCFPGAGSKDKCHHAWLPLSFNRCLLDLGNPESANLGSLSEFTKRPRCFNPGELHVTRSLMNWKESPMNSSVFCHKGYIHNHCKSGVGGRWLTG